MLVLLTTLRFNLQLCICAFLTPILFSHSFRSKREDIHLPIQWHDEEKYLREGGYIEQNDPGSEWSADNLHPGKPKCIHIPQDLYLCDRVPYEQMRLPNLLGHDTMAEVKQQAASWDNLIGVQCHADTQRFLCSLFAPVCLPSDVGHRPIWPCRSLCDTVQNSCEPIMMRWGFPWPDMVKCTKFPADNDLCIKATNYTNADTGVCAACNKAKTFEVVVDSFCNSDFAMRGRIRRVKVMTSKKTNRKMGIRLVMRKRKFFKRGQLTRKEIKKMIGYVKHGSKCECKVAVQGKTNYLIMGKKEGNRIFVNYLVVWERRNRSLRRAIKHIKKKQACVKGKISVNALPTQPISVVNYKHNRRLRNNKNRKKGRKKKRGGKRRRKNRKKYTSNNQISGRGT